MMKHLRLDQNIRKIIAIAIRWAQSCAGTSSHILQDTRPIPHLEGSWITNVREGLYYICGELIFEHQWVIPYLRENNRHITDKLLDSSLVQVEVMKCNNYCQYYLEATTVAEITT
eukprot:11068891-Ditylum_brightwellii.AAC.1